MPQTAKQNKAVNLSRTAPYNVFKNNSTDEFSCTSVSARERYGASALLRKLRVARGTRDVNHLEASMFKSPYSTVYTNFSLAVRRL